MNAQHSGKLDGERIYVAGHTGLVGSAVLAALRARGCRDVVTRPHAELDLTDQSAVNRFLADTRPSVMFMCAGRVGGILANDTYRADFIRDNLLMSANLIDGAWRAGVGKTVVLGSSCIYPRISPQPMREEYVLTGALEPTNEPYAVAKIASMVMAQSYRDQHGMHAIFVVPANLYGPRDNFHPTEGHVIPALLRRFHEAKEADSDSVEIWGSGTPVREFLYVEDLADAVLFLAQAYDAREPINVGCGDGTTVLGLAQAVAEAVGYRGRIVTNPSRPDGAPKRMLDASKMERLGWRPSTPLAEGLRRTYEWFLEHIDSKLPVKG